LKETGQRSLKKRNSAGKLSGPYPEWKERRCNGQRRKSNLGIGKKARNQRINPEREIVGKKVWPVIHIIIIDFLSRYQPFTSATFIVILLFLPQSCHCLLFFIMNNISPVKTFDIDKKVTF